MNFVADLLEPAFDAWDGDDGKSGEEEGTNFQASTAEVQQKEGDEKFTSARQGTDVSSPDRPVIR